MMESPALSSPQLLPTDPPQDEALGWAQGLGIEQGREPGGALEHRDQKKIPPWEGRGGQHQHLRQGGKWGAWVGGSICRFLGHLIILGSLSINIAVATHILS